MISNLKGSIRTFLPIYMYKNNIRLFGNCHQFVSLISLSLRLRKKLNSKITETSILRLSHLWLLSMSTQTPSQLPGEHMWPSRSAAKDQEMTTIHI